MSVLEHALHGLALGVAVVAVGGWLLASVLRRRHLRWTWALLGLPAGLLLKTASPQFGVAGCGVSLFAAALGARWHRLDLENGADFAEAARARRGIRDTLRALWGAITQMTSIRSHRERAPGPTWRLLAARGRRSSDGVQFGVQTTRKTPQLSATDRA